MLHVYLHACSQVGESQAQPAGVQGGSHVGHPTRAGWAAQGQGPSTVSTQPPCTHARTHARTHATRPPGEDALNGGLADLVPVARLLQVVVVALIDGEQYLS